MTNESAERLVRSFAMPPRLVGGAHMYESSVLQQLGRSPVSAQPVFGVRVCASAACTILRTMSSSAWIRRVRRDPALTRQPGRSRGSRWPLSQTPLAHLSKAARGIHSNGSQCGPEKTYLRAEYLNANLFLGENTNIGVRGRRNSPTRTTGTQLSTFVSG